jgi:hypothetical protein
VLHIGGRQHLEFVDVRADYERVELVVGTVSAEGVYGGAIGPAFVDAGSLGVKWVGGDDKVV